MKAASTGGVSVVEALVALLLGLFVAHGALAVAAKVRLVHRNVVDAADVLASVRLTASLLRTETAGGTPGRDWAVHDDSLWLRAFRGTGIICPSASAPDAVAVSWVGYRRPDPSKDSLLVVHATGAVSLVALMGVEPAPDTCDDRSLESGLVLRTSEPLAGDAAVARVFERGAYSVTDAALRYRRGAAGRQPLTGEVFEGGSGWRSGLERLDVALVERGRPAGRGLSGGPPAPPRSWLIGVARGTP